MFSNQIRQALDSLLNDMKNLPARLRQYASFEYVQKTIKGYLKVGSSAFSSHSSTLVLLSVRSHFQVWKLGGRGVWNEIQHNSLMQLLKQMRTSGDDEGESLANLCKFLMQ